MKKQAAIILAAIASTAIAAPPEGYYSSLEGLCGTQLKNAVKAKVRKHTVVSYNDGTWDAFRTTDTRTVNGTLCWWDMYSPNNVPVSSGHPGMNIEHSVANSCWGGSRNDAYKDLFHLNPSDATANNRKSNFPLGIVVGTPTWSNGITIVGKPASGASGGAQNVYEPNDIYKGDFARIYFYIFTVYDDISWGSYSDKRDAMYDCSSSPVSFRPWAEKMLLEWNAKDPVDTKETDRNDAVYKIQKNRNPFIDIPDLADYIWGAKKTTPFHYDPERYPENPDDPDNPDNPDNPDKPGTEGSWQLVTSVSGLNGSDTYIITDASRYYGLSHTLSGKFIAPTATALSDNDGTILSVPADIATVTLSGSGSEFSIGIAEGENGTPSYISSTSAKTITLRDTPGEEGTVAKISINADGEATVSYGAAGNLRYNISAPRFTTYTSGQTPLRFYRKIKTNAAPLVRDDLRLSLWAADGQLHIPAQSTVTDLWGRTIARSGHAEATIRIPAGIYIVSSPGYRPVKIKM